MGPFLSLPVCRLPLLQVRKPCFYFFLNKASELESVEFKFGSKQPKYPAADVRWAHSSRQVIETPHTQRHTPPHRHVCMHTAHTRAHSHAHMQMCAHTICISTCTLGDVHVYTAHIHTHPHTYIHIRVSTHICTPTKTYVCTHHTCSYICTHITHI